MTIARFAGAQRLPSSKLELVIRRDFLDADECAGLIALIDAHRRPSTIADDSGDPTFRTSETCDLDGTIPLVAAIDRKVAAFLGLDPAFGEPMQGQRYAVGQEFKLHTDYFEPDGPDYAANCAVSGQRTWTAMIYLDRPAAGGATRFKAVDKIIQPEPGKLIAWNNLDAAGRPNFNTLHQGMKVRNGTKHVVTKWYRQLPWGR